MKGVQFDKNGTTEGVRLLCLTAPFLCCLPENNENSDRRLIASIFRGEEEAACGYHTSNHSDRVSVCGDEVPSYTMRFLPTFEPVVMSFIPAAGRFSGDNGVSICSGEVSTRRMRSSTSSRW